MTQYNKKRQESYKNQFAFTENDLRITEKNSDYLKFFKGKPNYESIKDTYLKTIYNIPTDIFTLKDYAIFNKLKVDD